MLDIRCHDTLHGTTELRCQLRLGHEGPHAAIARTVNVGRELWQWGPPQSQLHIQPFHAELAAGLPWLPGARST